VNQSLLHRRFVPRVEWEADGIIQVYLDCDKKVMAFGYNGKYLGMIVFCVCEEFFYLCL
jgi:hypothetical protein